MLLLLGALAALAPRVASAPVDLGPTWLGAGVAVALSLRAASWRCSGGAVLAMWLGSLIAQAQGLPVSASPGVLAALSILTALQARWAAGSCRRVIDGQVAPVLAQLPSAERLSLVVRFTWHGVLVPALASGAMVGVLCVWVADGPWDPAAMLALGLLHAGGSALSVLLLVPLLEGGAGSPLRSRVAVPLWGLAAMLPSLAAVEPDALIAAPLVALAAGHFGGLRFAALCVATLVAGILVGLPTAPLLPFEGPDGFVVLLLFAWRLVGMGYLAAVWTERRHAQRSRARPGPEAVASKGAVLCRDTAALQGFAAGLASPSSIGWIRIDLGAPALPHEDARPALPSARHYAASRRVAALLRPTDAVVSLDGAALGLVLPGLQAQHLDAVTNRLQQAMTRDAGGGLAGASLSGGRVFDAQGLRTWLEDLAPAPDPVSNGVPNVGEALAAPGRGAAS